MLVSRSHLAPSAAVSLVLLASACGDGGVTPPPNTPPAGSSTSAPATSSAPETTSAAEAAPPVTADTTVLTEAQLAADKALAPKAAAVVDAFPDANGLDTSLVAQLTKDHKKVLFGSMRSGLPQIYLGDATKPEAEPLALTKATDRSIFAAMTADEKYVIVNRDHGADENWQFYRIALDGTGETLLTPNPKVHRDEPILPRNKPDLMIYSTHVATSPASQVVVQPVSGGEAKKVYEEPTPATAVDATADGSRALVIRWNSASDLVLLEIDTTGKNPPSRLYPPEGTKATIGVAAYTVDGHQALVATDEGKEGFAILAIDTASKATKGRLAVDNPSTAAVSNLKVSPKGDRAAVLIDKGSSSEIRILATKKLAFEKTITTPLGQINIGPWDHEGKTLAYWLSTPDHPADLHLLDAAKGTSTALQSGKRPGLDGLSPIAVSNQTVKAKDGLNIPINLYLPQDADKKKLPTIVTFHGGPSFSASIRWNPFIRFYTAQGYAVVEPNIRGSTGFGRAYEMADNREKRQDALDDMASVNAWAKAQPWCDPSKVVVAGGSYGGYLTLMAVTRQKDLWRAGVDLVGIANLKTFLRTTDQAIRAGFVDEFGDLDKDADLLEKFSPSRDYDKIVAPLFVYAGQNDPRVPRSESDQIVKALRERKIPVEYMVAANEGHSADRRETKIEFMVRVMRFLGEHLR